MSDNLMDTIRERDARLAEAMGWRWYWWRVSGSKEPVRGLFPPNYHNPYRYQAWATGLPQYRLATTSTEPPRFHADRDACAELLTWLSGQSGPLRSRFLHELQSRGREWPSADWLWLLATPAQIAEAAIAALDAAGKGEQKENK